MARKAPFWLFRNSAGKKDGAWTLLVLSFLITTGAYLTSSIEMVDVGDVTISMRNFDTDYAWVTMVPLCSLYFGRKYTDTVKAPRLKEEELDILLED